MRLVDNDLVGFAVYDIDETQSERHAGTTSTMRACGSLAVCVSLFSYVGATCSKYKRQVQLSQYGLDLLHTRKGKRFGIECGMHAM